MYHIQVSWLVSSRIEQARVAVHSGVIYPYRIKNVCDSEDTLGLHENKETGRWEMCFQTSDLADALELSAKLVSAIEELTLDPQFREAAPERKFIPLKDLEMNQTVLNALNTAMVVHDKSTDESRLAITLLNSEKERFRVENNQLKQGIKSAATDLKKTRSDKMGGLVGGKIRQIRLALEALIQ